MIGPYFLLYDLKDWQAILAKGLALNIPLYCSNPDLLSIRPGKKLITAPGLLAEYYSEGGGEVVYYGTPTNIFLRIYRLFLTQTVF